MTSQLNLLDEYKLFFSGKEEDLAMINNAHLFVLNKWLSFNRNNIEICSFVNKVISIVPPEVVKWLLYQNIDKRKSFIKYIKNIEDANIESKKSIAENLKMSLREVNEFWPLIKPNLDSGLFCTQLGFYFKRSEAK
jgi:hypothetical protein